MEPVQAEQLAEIGEMLQVAERAEMVQQEEMAHSSRAAAAVAVIGGGVMLSHQANAIEGHSDRCVQSITAKGS